MGKEPRKKFVKPANPVDQISAQKHINSVFKFNTKLGQHILKNPLVAQGIVDKAQIKPSDIVLEVGPGTGNLTMKILEKARRVIAIEMDPRMAAELTKRVANTPFEKKLEIILGDCIKVDLPYFDVCISNTPYQISSPLVFKLLNLQRPPRHSVLMFQREFALRLCAKPGDDLYGRLSANVAMFANVTHIMKVGKNNFRPPPKVESSVVRIEIKNPRPNINFTEWDNYLKVIFLKTNKTIRANFKSKAAIDTLEKNYKSWLSINNDGDLIMDKDALKNLKSTVEDKITNVLNQTELGSERPSKCDQLTFLKLLYQFHQEGIYFST
ncbi:putative dimethyladenosine transferase [Ascoidea rubescens DSM 1968]|uniref:rRNA adenine N(6)-methyltransferase n=1 Tax=Ascoidea rubescens DSM 1968 TaxID=1344418 RepID=A0A1D2VED8_9ASCO|nr:rRNA adenine dimethylase [Ascoidea rubescens DSM 1968]ODV59827.1 rRNA adenine dimethylase [Ascoidea rubescens DSM 1968]